MISSNKKERRFVFKTCIKNYKSNLRHESVESPKNDPLIIKHVASRGVAETACGRTEYSPTRRPPRIGPGEGKRKEVLGEVGRMLQGTQKNTQSQNYCSIQDLGGL